MFEDQMSIKFFDIFYRNSQPVLNFSGWDQSHGTISHKKQNIKGSGMASEDQERINGWNISRIPLSLESTNGELVSHCAKCAEESLSRKIRKIRNHAWQTCWWADLVYIL